MWQGYLDLATGPGLARSCGRPGTMGGAPERPRKLSTGSDQRAKAETAFGLDADTKSLLNIIFYANTFC